MKSFLLLLLIFTTSHNLFAQEISIEKVSRNPYFKHELAISGDTLIYYLSEFDKDKALPLIIYIQGSGYHSLFKRSGASIIPTSGHISLTYQAQNKAKILLIEKPGVEFLDEQLSNTRNDKFDALFSLESWSSSIIEVINHVVDTENIDTSKIMVMGHSEGGIVAATIANSLGKDRISNVGLLAGEGPSQLYSLYSLAKTGTFFNEISSSPEMRVKHVHDTWQHILADSVSTDKFFWGFTYLRWHSFLRTSSLDKLSTYDGSILIVQGNNDRNVNPESATILYNHLLSKDKDVGLEMIEDADHSFYDASNPDINGWDQVLSRVLDWFLLK